MTGIPDRGRRRLTAEVLGELAARVTPRDIWVLRLLWEHRTLTTQQIAQIAYRSPITANHRLLALYDMSAVDRFRPHLPLGQGSAPSHWILGQGGAYILAAENGCSVAEFGYRHERALAVRFSRQLGHLTGVNGFFAQLASAAHTGEHCSLAEWWSETRCAGQWGAFARPDGYGRWEQDGRCLDFFLEYDTGTETLARVTAKLDGYAELARATGIATPVLIYFTRPRREANWRRGILSDPPVPVATTSPAAEEGPAHRSWLPLHGLGDLRQGSGQRIDLIDLAPPASPFRADGQTGEDTQDAPRSAWSTRPRGI